MVTELIYLLIVLCYMLILFTGIFLLIRMIKTKLKNLFGLSMFFFMFAAQFFLGLFNILIIYAIISEIALIFLLFFIKFTYYKESKITFSIIIVIFTFLKIIGSILRLLYGFKIPLTSPIDPSLIPLYYILVVTVSIQITISLFWLSYAELSMYLRLKNHDIEPWVKMRYLILGISSASFLINPFVLPLIPIEGDYENILFTIIIAISIFVFSIGNLIGWVMPKKLKEYFNRNYSSISEESVSETELIDKINRQLKGGG